MKEPPVTDTLVPLVLDLVEWVDKEPRLYSEAIEIWRTSCPRLAVWEDAFERGYVTRVSSPDQSAMVMTTASGQRLLREHGRSVHGADRERSQAPISRT
jgi:hypothetical protein